MDVWTSTSQVKPRTSRNSDISFQKLEYDDQVDEASINPGKQRYEKMMAGMYLGELVRYILRDLCERGIVFTKDALTVLNQRG